MTVDVPDSEDIGDGGSSTQQSLSQARGVEEIKLAIDKFSDDGKANREAVIEDVACDAYLRDRVGNQLESMKASGQFSLGKAARSN